jgi:hypothetical protein
VHSVIIVFDGLLRRNASIVGHPTKRPPDGWDSVRFLELDLNDSSFPFRELVLPSRTPQGHNAGGWAAGQGYIEIMTDVILFIRHGWKSIWQQKTIWLFSAITILNQLYGIIRFKRPTDLLSSLVSITIGWFFIFLYYVSYIGVPYLAYNFLVGKAVTVQETLSAVKKFSARVIGCSCLSLLALSPLLFWVLSVSINSSTHKLEVSNKTILALLPLSIFAALLEFTIVGFFERDWGIRQSLANAWRLFTNHFGVLAIIGLLLAIISRVYSALAGTLTVLIQSGFDVASMSTFNALNSSTSLSNNLLFVLINGIGQIVLVPLSASIFITAYLKYNNVKLPLQMRIM